MTKERKRLIEILRERSYREGDFTLTSGRSSHYYIDCKATTLFPEGAYLTGLLFYETLMGHGEKVQAISGMTLGGDPLVTAVSIVSFLRGDPLPALIVRKEPKGHGTGAWIEGALNVSHGAKVALLDDVVTTGGSLLKAAKRLEEAGFKVSRVIALVDREEGGMETLRDAGIRLESIITRKELSKP